MNTTEIKMLLETVPDSYTDFVCGVVNIITKTNNKALCDNLSNYIKSTPDADTSAILKKLFDLYKPWEEHPEKYIL